MRDLSRKRTINHSLPERICETSPLIRPLPDQSIFHQNAKSPRRIAPRVQAQRHKALAARVFHRE